MRNQNKGFLLISVVGIFFLILSNYYIGSKLVVNKYKRTSSNCKNLQNKDLKYNIELFIKDEFSEIDKKISNGEYKDLIDYVVRKDDTEIWLGKSGELSENGFIIKKLKNQKIELYNEDSLKKVDYKKILEEEVKICSLKKTFEIEVLKKYGIRNKKMSNNILVNLWVWIEIEYFPYNLRLEAPNQKKVKQIRVEVVNEEVF